MLNRRTSFAAVLAPVGAATLVLVACGGGDQLQVMPGPCRSLAPDDISQQEAITIATRESSHITEDGDIQDTIAAIGSYRGECVWLVTLKGIFWPPSAPAVQPTSPVCAHVETKVWASAGEYLGLTFKQADDCDS
jgi:hypothetical protein